jgi:hypothetical protein
MTLAVLVPTVNRADKLQALVADIHATTTTPHRVYLVMEDWDTDSIDVADQLDTVDVIGTFGSNAAAVNGGYRASTEPFMAIVNDDCRFIEDWDTAALAHMSDTIHIVGINQGNGVCTSFSMARRSYIQEHSGVFDQPDTLYHEYVSQFPDTEFAEYARARGVWEDAPESLIEHMHWTFGKSAMDANYEKAQATFGVDQPVFEERRRQWTAALTS